MYTIGGNDLIITWTNHGSWNCDFTETIAINTTNTVDDYAWISHVDKVSYLEFGYAYRFLESQNGVTTFSTSDATKDDTYVFTYTMTDAISNTANAKTVTIRAIDDNCTLDLQTSGASVQDSLHIYDVAYTGTYDIDLPTHTSGDCNSCIDIYADGTNIDSSFYPNFMNKISNTRTSANIDPYTARYSYSGFEKLRVSTSNYGYIESYDMEVKFKDCATNVYDDSLTQTFTLIL